MALTRPSTSRDGRRSRRAIPSSTIPSAPSVGGALQELEDEFRNRAQRATSGSISPGVQTQFAAGMVNLKRDPFETATGQWKKAGFWFSGALAGPVTAYIYDWNLLPMGQIPVAQGTRDLQGVPAPSGSGELQPGSGHGRAQEGTGTPEPVTWVLADDAAP